MSLFAIALFDAAKRGYHVGPDLHVTSYGPKEPLPPKAPPIRRESVSVKPTKRRVQFYLDPAEAELADRFIKEHKCWSISELAYRAFMAHIHRYISQSEARAKKAVRRTSGGQN